MATKVSRVISGASAGPPAKYGTAARTTTATAATLVKPVAVRLHRLTVTGGAVPDLPESAWPGPGSPESGWPGPGSPGPVAGPAARSIPVIPGLRPRG